MRLTLLLFVVIVVVVAVVVAFIAVVVAVVVIVIAVIDDNDNYDTAAVSVFSGKPPVPSHRRSPVQKSRSVGQGQVYVGMFKGKFGIAICLLPKKKKWYALQRFEPKTQVPGRTSTSLYNQFPFSSYPSEHFRPEKKKSSGPYSSHKYKLSVALYISSHS